MPPLGQRAEVEPEADGDERRDDGLRQGGAGAGARKGAGLDEGVEQEKDDARDDQDPVRRDQSHRGRPPQTLSTAFTASRVTDTSRSTSASLMTSGGASEMVSPVAGCAPPTGRRRAPTPRAARSRW